MWLICLIISMTCFVLSVLIAVEMNRRNYNCSKKRRFHPFNFVAVGVFVAALFMFIPIHNESFETAFLGDLRTICLSLFNSMQVFTLGCEFNVVKERIMYCPDWLEVGYQAWAAVIFVLAPIFTFSFVLSMIKNITSSTRYLFEFFKDVYVFSELNEKALVLAKDIKSKHPKAAIIFTDVYEESKEGISELVEDAKKIKAIFFKNDILVVDFNRHSAKKSIFFFAIDDNETNNLNVSLKLIETYRNRENTRIYVFSKKIESELLLTAIDKGKIKVRRVNEVRSLVNRLLYEQGEILFDGAKTAEDGKKLISAVVVGMGNHGIEMVKALTWFCQMDGYKIEINAFDKDPLAREKFSALAPELMSSDYNGVEKEGEAQYKIMIHPGIDVETITFSNEIEKIKNATYVMVALGNDDVNIKTAVNLRMYFERMKIQPVIQTIIYNSQQKRALKGIKNFKGQAYNIDFIGDIESSYTENVIMNSELEKIALERHMKWGDEATFWDYEYNYRSSMAVAIHMKAREKCGISGSSKKEKELTVEERDIIENLEHRRWNAYTRADGYVYSKSRDKSSRNDLGKMHHDLVPFSALSEEEKRKDSKAGTK